MHSGFLLQTTLMKGLWNLLTCSSHQMGLHTTLFCYPPACGLHYAACCLALHAEVDLHITTKPAANSSAAAQQDGNLLLQRQDAASRRPCAAFKMAASFLANCNKTAISSERPHAHHTLAAGLQGHTTHNAF